MKIGPDRIRFDAPVTFNDDLQRCLCVRDASNADGRG
jgi:hypothetical protein